MLLSAYIFFLTATAGGTDAAFGGGFASSQASRCDLPRRTTCDIAATSSVEEDGLINPDQILAESAVPSAQLFVDDPVSQTPAKSATAVFGAGCFWGVQDEFARMPGIISVRTGYCRLDGKPMIPSAFRPSYVSIALLGNPGSYTECVKVTYDGSVLPYRQLLRIFWESHDASALSAASPGQYRSVIWPADPKERDAAMRDLEEAEKDYSEIGMGTVATAIADHAADEPAGRFTEAEPFHQYFWPKVKLKLVVLAFSYWVPRGCSYAVDWWEGGLEIPGAMGMGGWISNDVYWGSGIALVLLWIFLENVQLAGAGIRSYLSLLSRP